jgi:hypothetical protein
MDNTNKLSARPCPICKTMMFVIGTTKKGEKLTSCGHKYKFKKTRSQKEMDRRYISTPDGGLELIKGN